MHGFNVAVKGEAVVVDLGKRGVLFALMPGYRMGVDYGYYVVFDAFPYPPGGGQLTSAGIKYYSHLKAGPVELQPENYPVFVRFRDRHDPKTVENLMDMKPCPSPVTHIPDSSMCVSKDHFEESFGAGVHLKSVTIEMTKEPVTQGIVKQYAPSYDPIPQFMQWYKTLQFDDPRRFGPDALY